MKNLFNNYKVAFIAITLIALTTMFSCHKLEFEKANFERYAVTNVTATTGFESVLLQWETPANGNPDSYIIIVSPGGVKYEVSGDLNEYSIPGLVNGTEYTITIQAKYNDAGISGDYSVEITPENQLNFTALPGNEFVLLTWDKPNRDDIAGYVISWDPDGQEVEVAADQLSYTVRNLVNGTAYTFSIKVKYSSGDYSSLTEVTTTPGSVSAFITSGDTTQVNNAITFTFNPAYLPNSTATSTTYNFADGTTSTELNPIHTYTSTGKYDVTITITDNKNNTITDVKSVYIWGVKWKYYIGSAVKPQIPAVGADGTIYVGSEDNNAFHAVNPDGTLKWTYTGFSDNTYSSASIASDGTIYIGSKDKNLHAINSDGSQKWKTSLGNIVIYSCPTLSQDESKVYVGSDDKKFYAINTSDGSIAWTYTTGDKVRSTAAVATDGTIYFASDDDNVYALNADGTLKWSYNTGGNVEGGIAIDEDGTVIVSNDLGSTGKIFAINADGTLKWESAEYGRMISSPVIANGTVYCGTKSSELLALNKSTGSLIWNYTCAGLITSSPAVDATGAIYIGVNTSTGSYVVVNSDGTLKYDFGDIQVWSGTNFGNDNIAYFGSYDGYLYAIETFSGGLADDIWPKFAKNQKQTSQQ